MKKEIFRGSGVAMVTPMNNDGSVNYPLIEKLTEWHIKKGSNALIPCGTTGESATLTSYEWEKVVSTVLETAEGRVPVIAGTGSNNTAHAVELTKKAEKLGVDAALVVTPYYNKTSQQGLIKHFNTIAECSDIPVILYNVPSRTALNILPQTYHTLSEHPNIVATKEACGDISQIAKTIELCGDNLAVYSGNDDQILPISSLGGIGVITVLGNMLPTETALLCKYCNEGNYKEAKKLQLSLLPLINALFSDVSPMPIKAAMEMMGIAMGRGRAPLYDCSDIAIELLKTQIDRLNLTSRGF